MVSSIGRGGVSRCGQTRAWARAARILCVLAVVAAPLGFAPSALAAEDGWISGTVTDASTHAPIEGVEVCANPFGAYRGGRCAQSGRNGEYIVSELPAGTYDVQFLVGLENEHELDYASQYYSDKSHVSEAESVSVTAGQTTSGIDAAMLPGGKIAGVVTDAVTHASIEGIGVCTSGPPGEELGITTRCATTNSNGEYTLSPLVTGEYVVSFSAPFEGPLDYATQYYDGQSFYPQANKVAVTTGLTSASIDATMQPGGNITGRVTAAATGTALEGIEVCVLPVSQGGARERCAETNANGEYTVTQLAAGQDIVELASPFGKNKSYQREYDGGKMSYSEADPLTVEAGATVSGIDAALYLPGERPVNTSPAPVTTLSAGLTAAAPLITTTSSATTTPLVSLMASKLVVSGDAAPVPVTCGQAACQGSVELVVQVASKRHKGKTAVARKETLVLATGSFSLGAGRSGIVVLRLTAVGRRRLAHARRRPVAARLVVSVRGGRTVSESVVAG